MKKYVLAGALCLVQFFVFGGTTTGIPQNKILFSGSEEAPWKTEYRDADVLIESSVLIVENQSAGIKHERVIFKYTNLTAKSISVSFERLLYYDGVCYGCDKQEKRFSVELAPMESKQFSKENKDKTFYIFSKDVKNTITKRLDKYTLVKIEKQIK